MTAQTFGPVSEESRAIDGRIVLTFGYSRLSSDPQGRKLTHSVQNKAIDQTALRFGVPIPPVERRFSDTDKSASDEDVIRLGYQRLLKAIQGIDRSRYQVLVLGYKQDRILRQPREVQAFGKLVGIQYAGRLITATEGEISLKKGGRQTFLLSGALGQIETDNTSVRVTDALGNNAQLGKGHGQVPYGWTREYDHSLPGKPVGRQVVNEAQASVVREAVDRLLSGDSLYAICKDFNERGIRSPGAGRVLRRDEETRQPTEVAEDRWIPQKLRQIILRKANIAIRSHTPSGPTAAVEEYPAEWDAILLPDSYRRVCALLTDPARRTSTSSEVKYLLSGIGTCSVCHRGVWAIKQTNRDGAGNETSVYHAYRCPIGHLFKTMSRTDDEVISRVLTVLDHPEVRKALLTPQDDDSEKAMAQEREILARQSEAADMFADGEITREQLARMNARFATDLAGCRRVVKSAVDTTAYGELLTTDDIEAAWLAMPIVRQRRCLTALFDITLSPTAARGINAFDPESITVTPKF
jgi:site-specific DNA recombinase